MIKLKNLLSEKVTDVQWIRKAYNLALTTKFPFTPSIANILHKKIRIKAFHITSIDKLNQLNAMQGSKKALSTMTQVQSTAYLPRIYGVWHSGVMFYLEGTLLIRSDTDMMSEPDEQGRRWAKLQYNIGDKWNATISKDSELVKLENSMSHEKVFSINKNDTALLNKLRYDYLNRYIKLAEAFAKKYKKEIILSFISYIPSEYDEILLNEIKLIDVIWSGVDATGAYVETPQVDEIKNKLKSMVSGKVVVAYGGRESTIRKFVSSRPAAEQFNNIYSQM